MDKKLKLSELDFSDRNKYELYFSNKKIDTFRTMNNDLHNELQYITELYSLATLAQFAKFKKI